MDKHEDRAIGALVGLACGDAVGTTLEFTTRGCFTPISDMVGGGPFDLKAGQWTDDTSMALCLAYSLLDKEGFDPVDQMNRYCNWYRLGYMSSNGTCFDIGMTVSSALNRYMQTLNPFSGSTSAQAAGNGSIMRLAPIPIFYNDNKKDCIHYAGESSRTTHAAPECIEACKLLASLIQNAFTAESKTEILKNIGFTPLEQKVKNLALGNFLRKSESEIKGIGYVIDSLEAALWCFFRSDNFKQAILMAANLGDDADTTAAVCGQIAGAYYGYRGIPQKWSTTITMSEDIAQLAQNLYGKYM